MNIKINSLRVEIKSVIRDDEIKGFANLVFDTDQGEIKIKNGTIRLKSFGNQQKLSYEVPAIRTSRGFFNKVFFFDNKELYKKICDAVIKEYADITGEVIGLEQEEINSDEIPI